MLLTPFRQQLSHRLPFSPSGKLQRGLAFGIYNADIGTWSQEEVASSRATEDVKLDVAESRDPCSVCSAL